MRSYQAMCWSNGITATSSSTLPGFASTFKEIGRIDRLKNVDVTLKRGTKVRLRVRDSAGKPIPPEIMPLPQIYMEKHRREVWSSFAIANPERRNETIAATNFLNVQREPDGDFTFHVRTDESMPIYFGFSHPKVLRSYEKGPVPASDLVGGVWDVVLPTPASLDVSLRPARDAGGEPLFAAGYIHCFGAFPDWVKASLRSPPVN